MGKSTKKAKSDRINALRKQYDAFLEEDKKRKERNEYILGRLDNMRYSTALVPLRHKFNILDNRPAVNQPNCSSIRDFQSSITNQNQLTPDIQVKNYEDTFLIQEIGKKYILIPKLRSAFMNNYILNVTPNQNTENVQVLHPVQDTISMTDVNPNTNENTDWKTKYEILNILKNEESKPQTVQFNIGVEGVTEPNVNKQSLLRNNEEQVPVNYNNNINTDVHLETTNKYVNEFPEKDLCHDALHCEIKGNSEYNSPNDITLYASSFPNTYENNKDLIANVDPTDDIDFKLRDVKLEYNNSDATNIGPSVSVTDNKAQPEYDVNMPSKCAAISAKQNDDIYSEHIESESVYPVEVTSAIYDQNVSVEQHKSADSEPFVYLDGDEISPIQVVNPSGLTNEMQNILPFVGDPNNIAKDEDSHSPNAYMKTDVNVNIEDKVEEQSDVDSMYEHVVPVETVEQTENHIDVSGSIADFDTEQREMFYSESTDENNTYQQGDINALNPEYSQMEDEQNQENVYYVSIPQEPYPVEINDQEVIQQYDPNYEQQYVNIDAELAQQQHEQQPEQYQEHQGYDPLEPNFEQQQYEQQSFEIQEQVEQVLDVEDGYIDQQQLAETVEEQHEGECIGMEQSNAEEIGASEPVMR